MNNTNQPAASSQDETIRMIAKELLGLDTIETRKSDRLDFSDQAVWQLRAALEAAYNAGKASAQMPRNK